jgi:hypothetical protein
MQPLRQIRLALCATAAAAAPALAVHTNFVAYNDFGTVGPSAANVTAITVSGLADRDGDGDYEGSAHGELVDYASGQGAGAFLTFAVTNCTLANVQFEYGTNAVAGDAEDTFGGIVNCVGNVYGGNTAQQRYTVGLTGLKPWRRYELTLFSDRNYFHFKYGDYYRGRFCGYTIEGAESFINASTRRSVWVQFKTQAVEDDTTVIDIMHNGGSSDCDWGGFTADGVIDDGAVCRFAEVDPGPDGEFTVRIYPRNGTVHGDTEYYPGALWSGWGDEIHLNAMRLVETPATRATGSTLIVR